MDAARRRDGGFALRSGLRDARAHLRRARPPADHGAHAGRRLCLDGELARHLRAAQAARLAGTYLFYAALLAFVAAPLHAFALPRTRAGRHRARRPATPAPPVRPASGAAFLLLVAAFSAYAFIPSGLSAHLLAILQRAGIDAATVVFIGTLFGPSQVAARLCEFIFARNIHPLMIARFAVGLMVLAFGLLWLFGISAPVAMMFAVMFGAANGLITIARGAVPLALFGPVGYGRIVGRIARPSLIITALAPLAMAFVAERTSDPVALAVAAAFAVAAFVCFLAVRQ